MKTIKAQIALAVSLIVFIMGCHKDDFDSLSQTDQEVLVGMIEAYDNAQNYNDSLIFCAGSDHPCSEDYIKYCDSLFHYHENLWYHHHDHYSHDTPHADHYHDGHGMHHHGHCNSHDDSEGHHESQHQEMEHLVDEHEPYHP